MSGVKESWTVTEINKVLKEHKPGVWHYRPVPSRWGARILDYIGIAYGYGFVIEAKRPGKEPTPLQQDRLELIATAGGATFAIDQLQGIRNFKLWLDWCKDNPLQYPNWPRAQR